MRRYKSLKSDLPQCGTASDELWVHYTHLSEGEVTGQGACWVKALLYHGINTAKRKRGALSIHLRVCNSRSCDLVAAHLDQIQFYIISKLVKLHRTSQSASLYRHFSFICKDTNDKHFILLNVCCLILFETTSYYPLIVSALLSAHYVH